MNNKLESFTVKNFKCFGEEGATIEFAPITMLYGRNSSGKTALLQAMQLGRDILVEGKVSEDLGPFPYFVHMQKPDKVITLIFGTTQGTVTIKIMWDVDAQEPFIVVNAVEESVLEFVKRKLKNAIFMKRREHCPRDISKIKDDDWKHGLAAWRLLSESKELRDIVTAEMKRIAGDDWNGKLFMED